jgi:hypothetical protein
VFTYREITKALQISFFIIITFLCYDWKKILNSFFNRCHFIPFWWKLSLIPVTCWGVSKLQMEKRGSRKHLNPGHRKMLWCWPRYRCGVCLVSLPSKMMCSPGVVHTEHQQPHIPVKVCVIVQWFEPSVHGIKCSEGQGVGWGGRSGSGTPAPVTFMDRLQHLPLG